MKQRNHKARGALRAAIGVAAWPVAAAAAAAVPLALSQTPASGHHAPAPNVIVPVDGSSRMGGACNAPAGPLLPKVASARTNRDGSTIFLASYDSTHWTGEIRALTTDASAGAGAWGTVPGSSPPVPVSTATLLDAPGFSPSARLVLSAADGRGIDWRWDGLLPEQQAALGTIGADQDALGEQRLAYLRGDRSREAGQPEGIFRTRASRQGDIVNSQPWFQDGVPNAAYGDASYRAFRQAQRERPAMLYVGGNDGMLHAFSAASGEEKLAYVPEGLHPVLAELTHPSYRHRYFVDGSPLAGDLRLGDEWRTYLAVFLGAGGRGYAVLDATDPAGFSASRAASMVVMDHTAAATLDPDVGHIVAEPVMAREPPSATRQITPLNDGRWALVMGNGYNSPNGRAVLLVQYLDGARELRKLVADEARSPDATAPADGLGAPRLVDLDGDRIPDAAYAGDLQGRLWKFDLGASDPASADQPWGVAFDGQPLFTARDASGARQPITAAPAWLAHPKGGLMLVFGTGRHLTDADRSDTAPQSVYGVRDTTIASVDAAGLRSTAEGSPITTGRAALVEQTISAASSGTADASGARLWTFSANPVAYSGDDARRGWFIDLPERGERVLAHPGWFDGALIDVASVVPAGAPEGPPETCAATTQRQFLNTLNGLDGSAPRTTLYAYTPETGPAAAGTGSLQAGTPSRIETSLRIGVKTAETDKGICPPGAPCEDRARLGRTALRPSWRLLN